MTNKQLRAQAQLIGAKTFTPATPCKNGHISDRYTSSNRCIECDKQSLDLQRVNASTALELIESLTNRVDELEILIKSK